MNDNGSGHTLTVEQFDSASEYELIKILDGMKPNQKKLFLIELSNSEAERKSGSTDANTGYLDVQQRIDKVWQVYGVGGVSELLLNMSMSDDERNLVLKQLGRRHEIDALIYVGTKKGYENAKKRKDDVRRIFSAIDDERRKELLNDIFFEYLLYGRISRFNKLMKVLKEASVEYNEIADMLLGVRDKRIAIDMIREISRNHGNEYMANILLSIDDNDLGNMISGLKDKPTLILKILNGADDIGKLNRLLNGVSSGISNEYLANILLSIDDDNDLGNMISNLKECLPEIIAKILNGADDIGKLSRLFNIIKSSGISEEDMKTVLDKLVINKNIVNKMIDKPEDEQNKILGGIDNTQLVDKIKCTVKELEKLIKVGIAKIAVAVAVVVVVIEALFTRMSIKDALNNGHAMSDEAVISRIAMAAVAMLMMLSVIVYVKWANRPVWYDRLMIGGSLVMALVRVFMGVFGGMRVISTVMMVIMVVVMAIASVLAVINSKDEISDASKNAGGIAKSVIVVVSACVMAITGWVIQIMDMNVSSGMNNEMLQ